MKKQNPPKNTKRKGLNFFFFSFQTIEKSAVSKKQNKTENNIAWSKIEEEFWLFSNRYPFLIHAHKMRMKIGRFRCECIVRCDADQRYDIECEN